MRIPMIGCGRMVFAIAIILFPVLSSAQGLEGPSTDSDKASGQVYGFAMADVGYNAGAIDPDWFDTMRPTKLPSYEKEFGEDGSVYFSTRQTRFGTKFWKPTEDNDVRGIFEWEMFGVGGDAGQTTIRLRHAYLQYGHFGIGQYWSAFMDIGVFPNTVEYWGPSGMVFYRNIQVRYMPVMGDKHNLTLSLEKPGSSADEGAYNSFLEEERITMRYPVPDLAVQYRYMGSSAYLQVAGIIRNINWDDPVVTDGIDYGGSVIGWGINVTSNIKAGPGTIRVGVVFGEGIENYMNDATSDIAVVGYQDDDPDLPPTEVQAVPMLGTTLFYDWSWNEKWSSSAGFSSQTQDFDGTSVSADTFKEGRYGIVNVSAYPAQDLMMTLELQYGGRKNHADGWDYDAFRVQFSSKFNFNFPVGG